jgi:secretion/DNA translocation related TadE-like protein
VTAAGQRLRGEGGAAAVLVLALAGVLILVGAALGVVGALVADHRRAQAAADLAALAGAVAATRGEPACEAAAATAVDNDAVSIECVVAGRTVAVRVRVTGPYWLGQQADLEARARAGPSFSGNP